VITGTSTGIGVYTAEALVRAGYTRIFCLVRSVEKGQKNQFDPAIVGDAAATSAALQFVQCDLASLDSVDRAVREVNDALAEEGAPPLTTLICNAGVMFAPYQPTQDGLETHIGVNHVGHVFLVEGLFDRLSKAGTVEHPSRIIMLSSSAHKNAPRGKGFDFASFRYDAAKASSYSGFEAYGQSKLANMLHARWLQKRFDIAGAHGFACSVMPGVIPTELGRDSTFARWAYWAGTPFMKNANQGAATTVYCALSDEALQHPGGYFKDCAIATPTAQGRADGSPEELMKGTLGLIRELRTQR
jgi:retinol dehydrogenase-12